MRRKIGHADLIFEYDEMFGAEHDKNGTECSVSEITCAGIATYPCTAELRSEAGVVLNDLRGEAAKHEGCR